MKTLILYSPFIILLTMNLAYSQESNVGIFDNSKDIGKCEIPGSVSWNPGNQEYILNGSGENIWFDTDQFYFVYKKLSGDFILRAHMQFLGVGNHEHRKIGWMIRSDLTTHSPHVNGVVHGDGLTSIQFRKEKGGLTHEHKALSVAPDVVQLERKADRYILSTARFGKTFDTISVKNLQLNDEVYVGLFICSHDNNFLEEASFTNVRIIIPAGDELVPYQDYLGSNLEIMDVETGLRKIVVQAPGSIQAPNWAPDGNYMMYNGGGLLYNYFPESGLVEKVNTGFATNNNNDHVFSFDGKMLGISHHVEEEDFKSVIFVLPASGGNPERITKLAPSYLHGWSPDGKSLIYTAERNGQYDIYRIGIEDKLEEQLTNTPGLDDGSEYSPDGRHIYFNSARTGTMQIWRMNADGSGQVQLTFDEYNNWFPHISPDGQWILFLSYQKDVRADDHPFYKQVYIRLMPIKGGEPRVVAYVYGGQGTMNVPNWSPDGKRIAFISNTGKGEK